MTDQVTAELHNWAKAHFDEKTVIQGYIFGDTRGRFSDGTLVTTSSVTRIEGDVAFTRNSAYRLMGESK